jgi:hypothetical protein
MIYFTFYFQRTDLFNGYFKRVVRSGMNFSVFFNTKFVLQRVGLSAVTQGLQCTVFSIDELQKNC